MGTSQRTTKVVRSIVTLYQHEIEITSSINVGPKQEFTLATQQPQANNNVQTNTLSYAQAVTGISADATNKINQNHNCMDATTHLTTFLNEFKNMFIHLLNQNSMILSMLTTVINKLAQ
jgi:hypothetical protein